jgi:hypothetical protein
MGEGVAVQVRIQAIAVSSICGLNNHFLYKKLRS